jgi:hypothetical protein
MLQEWKAMEKPEEEEIRAGHTGATVNGSTLWRHPDEPGAEGATYVFV